LKQKYLYEADQSWYSWLEPNPNLKNKFTSFVIIIMAME